MGILDVKSAVAEIEASTEMLERALKLSGSLLCSPAATFLYGVDAGFAMKVK